jgi:hypothetical protein
MRFMRWVFATERGGELYAKRQGMIEPVFAHAKFNWRMDRFQRRGRSTVRSEWRLITALQAHQRAGGGLSRPPTGDLGSRQAFPGNARTRPAPPEARWLRLCATATAKSGSADPLRPRVLRRMEAVA